MRWFFLIFLAAFAVPAAAQEKSGTWPDFQVEQLAGQRIVLFRPNISVGEQSTGGLFEPRAEWTDAARQYIGQELRTAQGRMSNELVEVPNLAGADAQLVAQYQALFDTVTDSIIQYQFFPGNRLPTRRNSAFDWTLGQETSRLETLLGARYGLFVTTIDHYGSTGRKILQFAVGVQSGVHKGAAGLVDLRTGQVLWMNADLRMGGDVREPDGAARRVQQLLEDFPGMTPVAPAQ